MPGNDAGTSGQVLISQGAGTSPVWQTPTWADICNTATTNYVQKWTGTQLCNSIIFDNGTRVGVNTNTPTNKFEVVDGSMTFGIDSYRLSLQGDPYNNNTRYPYIEIRDDGGTRAFYLGWGAQGDYVDFVMENGNDLSIRGGYVGIGTSNPFTKLHVSDGNIELSNGSDGFIIGSRFANGYDYFYVAPRVGGTAIWSRNIALVAATGNVGLGTTSPSDRLHVAGNVRLDGSLEPNDVPGNSGEILVSRGAGNAPVWESVWKLWEIDGWNVNNTTSQGWTMTNGATTVPAPIVNCGGQYLIGGYNNCGSGCYMEKTFSGLPPHSEVMVEVFWWSIDSWDMATLNGIGRDWVELFVDGTQISLATPSTASTSVPDNGNRQTDNSLCGVNNYADYGPHPLTGYVSHSANTLTVRVNCAVNEANTNESCGIQMVKVYIK